MPLVKPSPMKIKIAWIGKTKQPEIEGLTQEYLKRLRHYAEVEGIAVKDESAALKLSSRDARPRHTLLLLDSHGKQLSSEEFAHWLADFQQRSTPLLIAIGPADGFSPEARKAARLVLSFGKMTMAHELARVILLEQLYRAFTILKGHPYHLGH
jgi:23S rRNA (pseudouridine1915-N3)-methyltransferase